MSDQKDKFGFYGLCSKCGAPVISRERRPNGNDKCAAGHTTPSSSTKPIEGAADK